MGVVAAPPNVSNVTLVQPTGTRVAKVNYTTDGPAIATFQFKIGGADINHSDYVKTVTGDINQYIPAAGDYTFTWDAWNDCPETVFADLSVEVTLWAADKPPVYCAVYLESAQSQVYWYGKESEVPLGVTDSRWKKNWLLLRQIPVSQGDLVTLGSPSTESRREDSGSNGSETQRGVCITKPFYMGVYQVTQLQWEKVWNSTDAPGNKPSTFNNQLYYEERPVESVSYNDIRGAVGDSPTVNWPATTNYVAPASFLGKLRAKVGGVIEFDLPTDAQWEYACRAGTSSPWNDGTPITVGPLGGFQDLNLDKLGRYQLDGGYHPINGNPPTNCTDENGTAKVGSYLPNAWGLYDMHGNVYELCRDWFVANDVSLAGDDPKGPTSSSLGRVRRGGSWSDNCPACRSAYRNSYVPENRARYYGFRVAARAEALIGQ
jgi:formylglycine-generating enzyme required for sulfatase activity